jgi:transglutaminase-like putative cysteine protease
MNHTLSRIACTTLIAGLAAAGCRPSPPTDPEPLPPDRAVNGNAATVTEATRETWEVYLLQGKRIGYGHTTTRLDRDKGRELIHTESLNHLAIKRDGQMSQEEIRAGSVETTQGDLIHFESEMRMGPNPIRTIGRVEGGQLLLATEGTAAPVARTALAWSADCRGPFATEQTLVRRPMQPGQRRKLKMLLIGLNQVADVELIAKSFETTALLGGTHDLLRIDTITHLPDGQKIEGTLWTDRTGETLKTTSQTMGLETYRASRAEALERAESEDLDLLVDTMVKVERPLPHPHQTKQVRYRVHLQNIDPARVFVTSPSQTVASIDTHTAEITVRAIRPTEVQEIDRQKADDRGDENRPGRNNPPDDNASGDPNPSSLDPPTDGDRKPNQYIQSDDSAIVAAAKKAAEGKTDPWQVVVALEGFVHGAMKNKGYTQAFATAAEVLRSLEGDCTEHGVLLAALARARGIPARVAVGLVYMESRQAFGYHLWTKVYVAGRWIPIDGTLGQGGIGAAHLEIAQTNLEGASVYSAFLPVVQVLGQLRIEILDWR